LINTSEEDITVVSEETTPFLPKLANGHTPPLSSSPVQETKRIKWLHLFFIAAMHLGAFAGFFTFSWKALGLCLVLHGATGCLGITLGFHRLLTHRSFKVPKILEYFFAILGSLACQGGPIGWVATHRLHHAKSDEEGDPHSPVQGFLWAHMLWCMVYNKNIDDPKEYFRLAPDLASDPVYVWLDKLQIVWTILLGIGLYVWGGWPFVIWGIFVRTALVYHSTWFVNSAAHIWGYQTYKTGDQSTNLWWVALLSYGEGWHNNHHAFQHSARHGLQWWEVDSTYLMIKFLERLGLAEAVKVPSPYLLETKAKAS